MKLKHLLAFLVFLLSGIHGAMAEGSRSLYPSTYPSTGYRANLDVEPGHYYVGKVNRLTFLYVYANAGEYILLGSSSRNSGGDIHVFNPQSFGITGNETVPSTVNFTCSATGTYSGGSRGYIDTRAHELLGPDSADGTTVTGNGYVPCAYQAPTTGIYGVVFTVATSGSSGPSGAVTPLAVDTLSVAAWDVTVRASASSGNAISFVSRRERNSTVTPKACATSR